MPWKECNPMEEKLRFVARLLDSGKTAPTCRKFGISRKTGYKARSTPLSQTKRLNELWSADFKRRGQ